LRGIIPHHFSDMLKISLFSLTTSAARQLAIVCIALLVVGCGNKDDEADPAPPKAEVEPEEEAANPKQSLIVIGIVDLERVYLALPEARAFEKMLVDRKNRFAERRARHFRLISEYESLVKDIKDPYMSSELRAQKRELAEEKAEALRIMNGEIEADIQSQPERDAADAEKKASLVEIASKHVEQIAEESGLDIVFDKGAATGEGKLPLGLGYTYGNEITEQVLETIGDNP